MESRLELHERFREILRSRNVYYQPPSTVQMQYPCIRYNLAGIDHKRASNGIYKNTNRYEVIVIDYDPESEIYREILNTFPMCSFDRSYTANNLNHFVLTLYY